MNTDLNTVVGDLLEGDSDLIIQQLNCLCVSPHGLSASIARKYPYANVYKTRQAVGRRNLAIPEHRPQPGTVVISSSESYPYVSGIFGQYDFGKAYNRNNRPPYIDNSNTIITETKELREQWFENGLAILKDWVARGGYDNPDFKIGIPYGIGCGLAGGNWTNYHSMLTEFSQGLKCQITLFNLG